MHAAAHTLSLHAHRALEEAVACNSTDDDSKSIGDQAPMLLFAVVLICLSGLFSGLNLGLMSFAEEDLKILIEGSSDPSEVKDAKRILPLRQRGNLLLCSLLLGNTMVNAMIAILLADMASGIVGGLVTTGVIVIFGEIVPQSICTRYGLQIGARSVPIVWVFVVLCFPIAWPISKLLDRLLGREITGVFSRKELLTLVNINVDDVHVQQSGLTVEDAKILRGALTFRDMPVSAVMTPLDRCFSLDASASLDKATFEAILKSGHTRIPVYEGRKDHIVALLFCKDLLGAPALHARRGPPQIASDRLGSRREAVALEPGPAQTHRRLRPFALGVPLTMPCPLAMPCMMPCHAGVGFERAVPLQQVLASFKASQRVKHVTAATKLNDAFELCKAERRHMLVVLEDPKDAAETKATEEEGGEEAAATHPKAVGLATFEDFLEEILQEEIVDETDVHISNEATIVGGLNAVETPAEAAEAAAPPAEASPPGVSPGRKSMKRLNSRVYDTTELLRSLENDERVSGRVG